MTSLLETGGSKRDDAIAKQVIAGNVPAFLRKLTPVSFTGVSGKGNGVEVIICVTPEYLSIGDDDDFVRVPLGLPAATRVADELGFVLPTTKMVDAIYQNAPVRMSPHPMKPTRRMSSTSYLLEHDQTLDQQRAKLGKSLGVLTAGQKKDVVLSNRLRAKPGRVAIYGWHRLSGVPIQPLSTVHGALYADYSHGVRLVSRKAFVDGKPADLTDILQDENLARIVNSEGPIRNVEQLIASLR